MLFENSSPCLYLDLGRTANSATVGWPRSIISRVEVTREIVVVEDRLAPTELRRLCDAFFGDMVKVVVDVERGIVAVGGELHADGEAVLLETGSRPEAVWGANYYPGRGPEHCVDFTALINIRPAHGNRAMEILDPDVRQRVRDVIARRIGEGEEV